MWLKGVPSVPLGIGPKETEIYGTDVLFSVILRGKSVKMAQLFNSWGSGGNALWPLRMPQGTGVTLSVHCGDVREIKSPALEPPCPTMSHTHKHTHTHTLHSEGKD